MPCSTPPAATTLPPASSTKTAPRYRLRGLISALDTTAKTFKIGDAVINYGGVPAAELPAAWPTASACGCACRPPGQRPMGGDLGAHRRAPGRRHRRRAHPRHGHRVHLGAAVRGAGHGGRRQPRALRAERRAVELGALVEVRGRASNGTHHRLARQGHRPQRRRCAARRAARHGERARHDGQDLHAARGQGQLLATSLEWKDGGEADLANGKPVEVKGLWSEDRSVLFAARIEFE